MQLLLNPKIKQHAHDGAGTKKKIHLSITVQQEDTFWEMGRSGSNTPILSYLIPWLLVWN